jgi:TRAP-type C4-dicarboxylate transport system permease small subunit
MLLVGGETGMRKAIRVAATNFLDPSLDYIRRVCRCGAWMGGILFFGVALLITFEVIIRKVFSTSTGAADELSGYGLAIASTFAFAFGLLERTHIRVDTFYLKLSPALRAICDVFAASLLLWFFSLILYYGGVVAWDSWAINAHSRTGLYVPLIIPQLPWWLGLCLTFVVAVLLLLRAIAHLAIGELDQASKLIGTRALEEEIADELAVLDEQRIQESSKL